MSSRQSHVFWVLVAAIICFWKRRGQKRVGMASEVCCRALGKWAPISIKDISFKMWKNFPLFQLSSWNWNVWGTVEICQAIRDCRGSGKSWSPDWIPCFRKAIVRSFLLQWCSLELGIVGESKSLYVVEPSVTHPTLVSLKMAFESVCAEGLAPNRTGLKSQLCPFTAVWLC